MMISQPAWWCLEATVQRLLRRTVVEPGAETVPDPPRAPSTIQAPEAALQRVVAAVGSAAPPSGSPADPGKTLAGPLTPAERRARAAALRALALSRGRRFDAARIAFTDAATLDPLLDLTRTPAFWKLERAAHEAAIDAYMAAGRDRDAAVLRARVHSTFRPRALRTRQELVFTS